MGALEENSHRIASSHAINWLARGYLLASFSERRTVVLICFYISLHLQLEYRIFEHSQWALLQRLILLSQINSHLFTLEQIAALTDHHFPWSRHQRIALRVIRSAAVSLKMSSSQIQKASDSHQCKSASWINCSFLCHGRSYWFFGQQQRCP